MFNLSISKTLIGFAIVLASQASSASTVDNFGIQVLTGETAYSVFIAIKGEESAVRSLCVIGDRSCNGNEIQFYMKEVEQLSCMRSASEVYCFVSGKSGAMPSEITGTTANRRLYDLLDTRALPLGIDSNGNGTPTGFIKTVAQVDCARSAKTGEFSCNIHFRQ